MKTFPISAIPHQADELLAAAERGPVFLTNENKPEFVILTIELYEKLKQHEKDSLGS